MTRRSIRNKIETLESETVDDDTDPFVVAMTNVMPPEEERHADRSDSPHPELTIRRWPEKKPQSFAIATPNILPEPYRQERTLVVRSCDKKEQIEDAEVGFDGAFACELWEAMDEEQLQEEKRYREANNEPIPPFLEGY